MGLTDFRSLVSNLLPTQFPTAQFGSVSSNILKSSSSKSADTNAAPSKNSQLSTQPASKLRSGSPLRHPIEDVNNQVAKHTIRTTINLASTGNKTRGFLDRSSKLSLKSSVIRKINKIKRPVSSKHTTSSRKIISNGILKALEQRFLSRSIDSLYKFTSNYDLSLKIPTYFNKPQLQKSASTDATGKPVKKSLQDLSLKHRPPQIVPSTYTTPFEKGGKQRTTPSVRIKNNPKRSADSKPSSRSESKLEKKLTKDPLRSVEKTASISKKKQSSRKKFDKSPEKAGINPSHKNLNPARAERYSAADDLRRKAERKSKLHRHGKSNKLHTREGGSRSRKSRKSSAVDGQSERLYSKSSPDKNHKKRESADGSSLHRKSSLNSDSSSVPLRLRLNAEKPHVSDGKEDEVTKKRSSHRHSSRQRDGHRVFKRHDLKVQPGDGNVSEEIIDGADRNGRQIPLGKGKSFRNTRDETTPVEKKTHRAGRGRSKAVSERDVIINGTDSRKRVGHPTSRSAKPKVNSDENSIGKSRENTGRSAKPPSKVGRPRNIKSTAWTVNQSQKLGQAKEVEDLVVLPGTKPLLNRRLIPKKEVAISSKVQKLPDEPHAEPADILLQAILSFKRFSIPLSIQALKNNRCFCNGRISMAIVPGCQQFDGVDLVEYMRKLGRAHVKMFETIMTEKDKRDDLENIDYVLKEEKWIEKAEKFWISEEYRSRGKHSQIIPPLLTKTSQVLQFFFRVLSNFMVTEGEVDAIFFKDLYCRGVVKAMGRLILLVLSSWDMYRNRGISKAIPTVNWALKLLSKLFNFELRQLSSFPKDVEEDHLLLSQFSSVRDFGLRKMFDIGFEYISSENRGDAHREFREASAAFVEIIQFYFTSMFCPLKKIEVVQSVWDKVKDEDMIDGFDEKEVFWMTVVQTPLQSAVRSATKMYEAHSDIAFVIALLRQRKVTRTIFTRQSKTKEAILDMALRALRDISRDPLSVFMAIWKYKQGFDDAVTCIDLIKTLMTHGFSQRELISTCDIRRNEFFDVVRELITNSTRLGWESIGPECVEMWWRRGPFGKTVKTLQSRTDPIRLLKEEEERFARQYAFSCIAWLLGSLGVCFDDESRDISKQNIINTMLLKVISPRGARQFLEEMLTIQHHLERFIYVPVAPKDPADKKETMRKVVLFSDQERDNFCRVVEAVRFRVCDLKNVSKFPPVVVLSREAGKSNNVAKQMALGWSMPDVVTLPSIQMAVVSRKGYVDLEDDVKFMKSVAKHAYDRAEQTIGRFESNSDIRVRWSKLKRNAYVDDARGFLSVEERSVGQMCTCLSVRRAGGGARKISCSNEMCENRMAKMECGPGPCGAGGHCRNRRLQNLEYARTKKSVVEGKGIGLIASELINEGALIGEYQGEIVSMEEYGRRNKEYTGECHFYFMTLTTKLVIDASRRSQVTRYVNHSCDPNCVAEKWNAGGEPRVAIITKRIVQKDEELTFDYGAMAIGNDSAPCLCGATNCRGKLTSSKKKEPTGTDADAKIDVEMVPVEVTPKGKDQREDTAQIVENNILRAKKRMERSKDLRGRLEGKPDVFKHVMKKDSSQLDLNHEEERRLELWKKTLRKRTTGTLVKKPEVRKPVTSPPMSTSLLIDKFRIPRLNPKQGNKGAAAQFQPANTKDPTTTASRFNPSNQRRPSAFHQFLPKRASFPTRGSIQKTQHSHSYAPGCAPSLLGTQRRNQRPHVGPVESLPNDKPQKSVFQPTKSRLDVKKKNRRPPIQPKIRSNKFQRTDSDNESWSTASTVNSVADDYVPPPIHLKGLARKNALAENGSSGEFQPAPPVQREDDRRKQNKQITSHEQPRGYNHEVREVDTYRHHQQPNHHSSHNEQYRNYHGGQSRGHYQHTSHGDGARLQQTKDHDHGNRDIRDGRTMNTRTNQGYGDNHHAPRSGYDDSTDRKPGLNQSQHKKPAQKIFSYSDLLMKGTSQRPVVSKQDSNNKPRTHHGSDDHDASRKVVDDVKMAQASSSVKPESRNYESRNAVVPPINVQVRGEASRNNIAENESGRGNVWKHEQEKMKNSRGPGYEGKPRHQHGSREYNDTAASQELSRSRYQVTKENRQHGSTGSPSHFRNHFHRQMDDVSYGSKNKRDGRGHLLRDQDRRYQSEMSDTYGGADSAGRHTNPTSRFVDRDERSRDHSDVAVDRRTHGSYPAEKMVRINRVTSMGDPSRIVDMNPVKKPELNREQNLSLSRLIEPADQNLQDIGKGDCRDNTIVKTSGQPQNNLRSQLVPSNRVQESGMSTKSAPIGTGIRSQQTFSASVLPPTTSAVPAAVLATVPTGVHAASSTSIHTDVSSPARTVVPPSSTSTGLSAPFRSSAYCTPVVVPSSVPANKSAQIRVVIPSSVPTVVPASVRIVVPTSAPVPIPSAGPASAHDTVHIISAPASSKLDVPKAQYTSAAHSTSDSVKTSAVASGTGIRSTQPSTGNVNVTHAISKDGEASKVISSTVRSQPLPMKKSVVVSNDREDTFGPKSCAKDVTVSRREIEKRDVVMKVQSNMEHWEQRDDKRETKDPIHPKPLEQLTTEFGSGKVSIPSARLVSASGSDKLPFSTSRSRNERNEHVIELFKDRDEEARSLREERFENKEIGQDTMLRRESLERERGMVEVNRIEIKRDVESEKIRSSYGKDVRKEENVGVRSSSHVMTVRTSPTPDSLKNREESSRNGASDKERKDMHDGLLNDMKSSIRPMPGPSAFAGSSANRSVDDKELKRGVIENKRGTEVERNTMSTSDDGMLTPRRRAEKFRPLPRSGDKSQVHGHERKTIDTSTRKMTGTEDAGSNLRDESNRSGGRNVSRSTSEQEKAPLRTSGNEKISSIRTVDMERTSQGLGRRLSNESAPSYSHHQHPSEMKRDAGSSEREQRGDRHGDRNRNDSRGRVPHRVSRSHEDERVVERQRDASYNRGERKELDGPSNSIHQQQHPHHRGGRERDHYHEPIGVEATGSMPFRERGMERERRSLRGVPSTRRQVRRNSGEHIGRRISDTGSTAGNEGGGGGRRHSLGHSVYNDPRYSHEGFPDEIGVGVNTGLLGQAPVFAPPPPPPPPPHHHAPPHHHPHHQQHRHNRHGAQHARGFPHHHAGPIGHPVPGAHLQGGPPPHENYYEGPHGQWAHPSQGMRGGNRTGYNKRGAGEGRPMSRAVRENGGGYAGERSSRFRAANGGLTAVGNSSAVGHGGSDRGGDERKRSYEGIGGDDKGSGDCGGVGPAARKRRASEYRQPRGHSAGRRPQPRP